MRMILPGGTIGILGGGQLGRMMAMAARSLGLAVHVLDPDPDCAASAVCDRLITAPFQEADAARELGRSSSVVTLEIEKIPIASIEAAAEHAPVRPGAHVLEVVQHRGRQKDWLTEHGFPVAPYRTARNADEVAIAVAELNGQCLIKSSTGGYDGRGQAEAGNPDAAREAWLALGGGDCVVERFLELEAELSVLVGRSPGGEAVVYPPALNHHDRQVLMWSVLPAPLPSETLRASREVARDIASALSVEGLLAVEMFLLGDGTILVNELAPRPHNSFHHTEVACVTSQFEQAVRAVCDLPLGSPDLLRPTGLVNLFGDLWDDGGAPHFEVVLAIPGVRLFLYGKTPRPGRKIGHLTATGDTPAEALERARAAYAKLARNATERRKG